MDIKNIKFFQLNCNNKFATGVLVEKDLMEGKFDIALLQEPPINRVSKLLRFSRANVGEIFSGVGSDARSVILVGKHLKGKAILISQLSDANMVTIRINAGSCNYLICSFYAHHVENASKLAERLGKLNEYARKQNSLILIGGDFNARHDAWGSDRDDARGRAIINSICDFNWHLLNNSSRTFHRRNGYTSTLDLTMVGERISEDILKWSVISLDYYGSDHIPINFTLRLGNKIGRRKIRNIKRINWKKFDKEFKKNSTYLDDVGGIWCKESLDVRVGKLQAAILDAYHEACPLTKCSKKIRRWENVETKKRYRMMKTTHNLLKKRKRQQAEIDIIEGLQLELVEDRDLFTEACVEAKKRNGEDFISEINNVSDAARITNVFKKMSIESRTLKDVREVYSDDIGGTIDNLMEKHFPGSISDGQVAQTEFRASREEKRIIGRLVTEEKVKSHIMGFSSYKCPSDDIYPILLKRCIDRICSELVKIYKFCLKSGITPMKWLEVRIIFIPKQGKTSYDNPSSFRPISLMAFLFKTLEKISNEGMFDKIMELHERQYAYRPERSCINALNDFMEVVNPRMDSKRITLVSFLDIEGAFNNISFARLERALRMKNIPSFLIRWIMNANSNRILKTKILEVEKKSKAELGIAQGSNSAPFYFLLYVDELIRLLNEIPGIEAFMYSDDIAIVCTADDVNQAANILENTLRFTANWCRDNEVSVNPDKAKHVAFRHEDVNFDIRGIKFGREDIIWSDNVKYLGVIMDKYLNFNEHFRKMKINIIQYSLRLRCFVQKNWGFNPTMAKWCYDGIIIPRITYASSIWIHTMNNKLNCSYIDSAQNIALRAATCAMRGTPNKAIKMAIGVVPIRSSIKINATMELCRLLNAGKWRNNNNCMAKKWKERTLKISKWCTKLDSTVSTSKGVFKTVYPTRDEWSSDALNNRDMAEVFMYTDASVDKNLNRTGVGIFCRDLDFQYAGKCNVIMSSFKAEMIAISMALSMAINKKISNTSLCVITDSMSSMLALEKTNYRSKIANGIHNSIKKLNALNVNISFMWVPSHTGQRNIHVIGNDMADDLSRSIYAKDCMALRFAHLCKKELRNQLHEAEVKKTAKFPTNSHTTSKKFKFDVRMRRGETLNRFNRKDFNILLRFMTGFSCLSQHMKYIWREMNVPSIFCRYCNEYIEETSIHITENCSFFNARRLRIFGKVEISLDDEIIDLDKLLEFISIDIIKVRLLRWFDSVEAVKNWLRETSTVPV